MNEFVQHFLFCASSLGRGVESAGTPPGTGHLYPPHGVLSFFFIVVFFSALCLSFAYSQLMLHTPLDDQGDARFGSPCFPQIQSLLEPHSDDEVRKEPMCGARTTFGQHQRRTKQEKIGSRAVFLLTASCAAGWRSRLYIRVKELVSLKKWSCLFFFLHALLCHKVSRADTLWLLSGFDRRRR